MTFGDDTERVDADAVAPAAEVTGELEDRGPWMIEQHDGLVIEDVTERPVGWSW